MEAQYQCEKAGRGREGQSTGQQEVGTEEQTKGVRQEKGTARVRMDEPQIYPV